MERDRSALPLVNDIHAKPQDIAQLALQGRKVRVDRLCRVSSAGPGDIDAGPGEFPSLLGARFGLANRKAFRDDYLGQRFRIRCRRDRARVAHRDIASQ